MISNTVKTDKQIKQIRYCFINLILVLQVGNRTGGTTPSKFKKKSAENHTKIWSCFVNFLSELKEPPTEDTNICNTQQ